MPFVGPIYTPPVGAENAAPGQVLQSAVWDAIFTDIAAALTQLATQAVTTPNWANILAPNGGFAVWQRGSGASASFSVNASTTQYTADRWYIITGANQASVVAAATGLTTALSPAHAAKITRTSGQAGITAYTFGYPLTSDEVARFRGQVVSFSGAAKAGANWSPASGAFTISLLVGTGTAQKSGLAGANFSSLTTPLSITTDFAAGATNAAITGTSGSIVPVTSTQAEIQVTWTPVGTAGTDDSLTLDQFCLVAGSIVQTFEDLPFDLCLRECKRFYRKSFPYATAPAQNAGLSGAVSLITQAASFLSFYVQFESIELYVSAAMTTYNPSGSSSSWVLASSATVTAATDPNTISPKGVLIYSTSSVTGSNETAYIHYSADSGL